MVNNKKKKKERSSVSRSVCGCVCVRVQLCDVNDDICTYLAEDEKLRQSSKSTQNNFKQKARKKHRAIQRKTTQNIASRIVVGAVTSKEAFFSKWATVLRTANRYRFPKLRC